MHASLQVEKQTEWSVIMFQVDNLGYQDCSIQWPTLAKKVRFCIRSAINLDVPKTPLQKKATWPGLQRVVTWSKVVMPKPMRPPILLNFEFCEWSRLNSIDSIVLQLSSGLPSCSLVDRPQPDVQLRGRKARKTRIRAPAQGVGRRKFDCMRWHMTHANKLLP